MGTGHVYKPGKALIPVVLGHVVNEKPKHIAVVKLTREDDSPESLNTETTWMTHLDIMAGRFDVRFHVPASLDIDGSHVFRIPVRLPCALPAGFRIKPRPGNRRQAKRAHPRNAQHRTAPDHRFVRPRRYIGLEDRTV